MREISEVSEVSEIFTMLKWYLKTLIIFSIILVLIISSIVCGGILIDQFALRPSAIKQRNTTYEKAMQTGYSVDEILKNDFIDISYPDDITFWKEKGASDEAIVYAYLNKSYKSSYSIEMLLKKGIQSEAVTKALTPKLIFENIEMLQEYGYKST